MEKGQKRPVKKNKVKQEPSENSIIIGKKPVNSDDYKTDRFINTKKTIRISLKQ